MHELELRLPSNSSFSAPAADELKSILNGYSSSIIAECNRLAAAEALDGRQSEITAAIVKKANTVFQISNGIDFSHRSPIWLRISSVILPILTGAFPNLVNMKAGTNLLLMMGLLVLSTAAVVALIIKDRAK
jgi:hypothetical protein